MKLLSLAQNPRVVTWFRRVRRVVWVLLLAAGAWFAVARWRTPPVAHERAGDVEARLVDVEFDGLCAVLERLPPCTGQSSASPKWWADTPAFAGVSCGAWDPQRPIVQTARTYFADLRTATYYLQLAARCEACAARVVNDARDSALGAHMRARRRARTMIQQRNDAIAAFTARARLRANDAADLIGAHADLLAACRLCDLGLGSAWGYAWDTSTGADLGEWRCLAREYATPPDVARAMIACLEREGRLSVSRLLEQGADINGDIDSFLDRYYTDTGQGDGWLVLSYANLDAALPFFGGGSASDDESFAARCGAWNLLSPVFNGRRTVHAKIARWQNVVSRLDTLDCAAAQATLRDAGLPFAVHDMCAQLLDGPVGEIAAALNIERYTCIHARAATYRALVVMLALSAYRYDHESYPETLDTLVPNYLTTIPLDLNAQAPLVYERTTPNDYRLSSAEPLDASLQWGVQDGDARTYSISRPPLQD